MEIYFVLNREVTGVFNHNFATDMEDFGSIMFYCFSGKCISMDIEVLDLFSLLERKNYKNLFLKRFIDFIVENSDLEYSALTELKKECQERPNQFISISGIKYETKTILKRIEKSLEEK